MTSPAVSPTTPPSPARTTRVLWVAKGLGRGGAERLLVAAAKRIDQRRFDVEVVYLLTHKDALVDELAAAGVSVHCLGGGAHAMSWVWRLRRLLAHSRFDLVHTHSPVAAAATRVLAPAGTRLLHTEHNVWSRYRLPTRLVNAITFARNERGLAVSQGVADSMRLPRWLPGPALPPVETLIHGVDPDDAVSGLQARAAARRRLGLPDDAPVVGTVGNLTPKKDQATLLRAVAGLDGPLADTRVVVCGDGPEAAALEREASRLGLGDRALLLGSRGDVPELLPAFDVFALSSLHEGLSIALLEALAAGVPCVVTRVGGLAELVTDEVGFLVPPQDPGALTSALGSVLSDEPMRGRMACAARQRAEAFSIDAAVTRLQQVYGEVLT